MDSIRTQVSISKTQILEALTERSNNDLIEFVKDLDLAVADWEFTLRLINHFKKLGNEFVDEEEA